MPRGLKTGVRLFEARLHVIQNILLKLSDYEFNQALEMIKEIEQVKKIRQ
jgi:hypothetical protein